MNANPSVNQKICFASLWFKIIKFVKRANHKFSLNLKEVNIGLVDRRLKVALSDRPNIISNFPSQENMDGFTFNPDPVPDPEEGVGVRPTKGNWIVYELLHFNVNFSRAFLKIENDGKS